MGVIFTWWAVRAAQKFAKQPTVTDIKTMIGEDGVHLKFPMITICDYQFTESNPVLKDCLDSTKTYLNTLKKCVHEADDDFVSNFNNSLEFDQSKFMANVTLRYIDNDKTFPLNSYNLQMWSPVFHERYGLCYSLNVSSIAEYSLINYMNSPILRITIENENPWKWITVFIHSDDDLPDALFLQPRVYVGHTQVSSI